MEQAVSKEWIKKGKNLLFAAFLAAGITAVSILLFAFILWKAELSASIQNIGLIVIRVLSCFAGGFVCGRKNRQRRFLWGLGTGLLYFLVLMILRLSFGSDPVKNMTAYITTFLYCAGSGMLGGMLS